MIWLIIWALIGAVAVLGLMLYAVDILILKIILCPFCIMAGLLGGTILGAILGIAFGIIK